MTLDTPTPAPRLQSLDALRGFDMFWIVGADAFVHALGRMSPSPVVQGLAAQLDHADWEGFRFYDLIFPLFVFLVGVSIVFSLTRTLERDGRPATYWRIVRRFLLLYFVAMLYSGGVANTWPDIRLMGVLNRIALCYLAAALLFCHLTWRGLAATATALLVGYWALMTLVPYPDVRPRTESGELTSVELKVEDTAQLNLDSTARLTGVVGPGLNLSNYIDQKYLPGRKYDHTWDPEGLLSTLPAVATCLLGVLAGLLLQITAMTGQRKVVWLIGTGVAGVAAGWLWGLEFPVIKKIWTSSYVLVAGGYSAILLGVFYQIIDVWNRRAWAQPFVWIGSNAIAIYMAANIINFRNLARRFAGGDVTKFLDARLGSGWGGLLVAAVAVALIVWLANFLYRRKIFLRV